MSDSLPTAVPHQPLTAPGAEINAMANLFASLVAGLWTVMPVLVVRVYGGTDAAGPGIVDVQPLPHQVDGAGNVVPHGIINGVPFARIQGGTNAVVVDPQPGDLGVVVFAMRDTSAALANRAPSQPGSNRRYSASDGMYLMSLVGAPPINYVRVSNAGVKIKAASVEIEGELRVTGDVIARYGGQSVTLSQHTHPSNGAPPTPGT